MNFELFVAKRIHFTNDSKKSVSRPAVKVASLAIALGLAIMLISIAVVIGFKHEIRDKVIGFGSHIQITKFENNTSFDKSPINLSDSLIRDLKSIEGVRHVQPFATKPGMIKTDEDVQAVVFKGVDKSFDWGFYKKNLIEGDTLVLSDAETSKQAIISLYIAQLLQLKVGDDFLTYFVHGESVRVRKLKVVGIYCTNFVEYDKQFILTDIRQVRELNYWEQNQASGLEVLINNFNQIDEVSEQVYFKTANQMNPSNSTYFAQSIKELQPQIFDWLNMLDVNVWIILILMLAVSGFSMISGLLIIILERTNMIGIMKAMGAANNSIRKVFLYQSFFIIIKGIAWGNVVGLSVLSIQYFTQVIPLDPASYYVSFVPVEFNWMYILLTNIGVIIGSMLMLLLPSYIVSRILPAKSIRFE